MDLAEQAPPAKQQRLDADLFGNESDDGMETLKSSYASEVSRRLYLDKETVDVFFTFEDSSERVAAHRCVLANASKYLRVLLYGKIAPKGDILLRDTPTEAFKIVLKFCYLDEVKLKLDNITAVMKLLDQYGMVESLELCGRVWAENWSIYDICSAYSWATRLHMAEFRKFCERKISVHSDAVFQTDGFLSCSFEVLDQILSLNSLLSAESTVLGACLKWARAQCELNGKDPNDTENLRAHLKDQLYKIRYGSMTHDEFLGHMDECSGLFANVGEYEDVMRLLSGKTNLKTGKFQTEPRKQISLLFNENETLEYAFLTKHSSASRETNKKRLFTNLKTNHPILLIGFQMVNCSWIQDRRSYGYHYGTNPAGNQMYIDLEITELQNEDESESEKSLFSGRVTISSSGRPYFDLKPNYVLLKPNLEYHFQFDFKRNGENYYNLNYDHFEAKREIELNESVTVEVVEAENDIFLIEKCKFAVL